MLDVMISVVNIISLERELRELNDSLENYIGGIVSNKENISREEKVEVIEYLKDMLENGQVKNLEDTLESKRGEITNEYEMELFDELVDESKRSREIVEKAIKELS